MAEVPDPKFLPNADEVTVKELNRLRMMWSALVLILLAYFAFTVSVGSVRYGLDQAYECAPIAESLNGEDPTGLTTPALNAQEGLGSQGSRFAKHNCHSYAIWHAVGLLAVAGYPAYAFVRSSRRL